MAETVRPAYLPRDLASEVRVRLPEGLSNDDVYKLRRFLERAYARGYDDGHGAGFDEGYDYHKRATEEGP